MANARAQSLLRLAMENNTPETATAVLRIAFDLASKKELRGNDAKELFESSTRSTRSLAERARVLYRQPEHASAIAHPVPRFRSAYDWLFLDDNAGNPLDLSALEYLLVTPLPSVRISKRSRFAHWLDERQALVNDTLLLCEIIINRMVFK